MGIWVLVIVICSHWSKVIGQKSLVIEVQDIEEIFKLIFKSGGKSLVIEVQDIKEI